MSLRLVNPPHKLIHKPQLKRNINKMVFLHHINQHLKRNTNKILLQKYINHQGLYTSFNIHA